MFAATARYVRDGLSVKTLKYRLMIAMLAAMDTFPDLGSLSDQELKDLIQQLTDEEQSVYRRRILHGKIDILRAELVNRARSTRAARTSSPARTSSG